MSERQCTVISQLETPSEAENDDIKNQTENIFRFAQNQTYVEPNTNPTKNTQQNPLQNPESSCPEIITEQIENPSLEIQEQFSDVFSLQKIQAEIEH